MRVAILTFHNSPNNAGAVLQAWALQRTLEEMGHEAVIVDYHRQRGDLVPWWSFKSLRQIYHTLKRMPWETIRLRECDRFRRRHLNLVGTQFGGRIGYREADAYIVGSDQVFNPLHNEKNPDFLLDFAPLGKRRIAYGASFGTNAFDADYLRLLVSFLPKFDALSVRETLGVEMIKHIAGVDARLVLDPTLLLASDEYTPLMGDALRKVPTKPYVFLYLIGSHPDARRIAVEKAKEVGATRIVMMTNGRAEWHGLQTGAFRRIHVFTPADFLSHISQAAYVVTNSFHGTAFSLIFRRRFTSLKNGGSGDARMATLLKAVADGGLARSQSASMRFLQEALA